MTDNSLSKLLIIYSDEVFPGEDILTRGWLPDISIDKVHGELRVVKRFDSASTDEVSSIPYFFFVPHMYHDSLRLGICD